MDADLSVELPHYGPHSLRHACATRLLNQGLSLKEIGDHLGHTNPDTTRIYAKVDLAQLREVGQIDLRGLA
jgi:integrase/recombinase XerD